MINTGERVKATLVCDGKSSVQYETGQVIYVGHRLLVEFDRNVCGHTGNGLGTKRKCWMMDPEKVRKI